MKTIKKAWSKTLVFFLLWAVLTPGYSQLATISIKVRDAYSGAPIEKVDVFTVDTLDTPVFQGVTRTEGEFEIKEYQRGPGDRITIKLSHPNYKEKVRSYRINNAAGNKNKPANHIIYFMVPKDKEGLGEEILVSGDVLKKPPRKNKEGVVAYDYELVYIDTSGIPDFLEDINEKGYFFFYPRAEPGDVVSIRIRLSPESKYKPWVCDYTIKKEGNYLNVQLQKYRKVPPQCYAWGAATLLAGSAVYHKLESNRLYSNHKNPFAFDSHDDWLSTYQDAKRAQDWYVYSSAGAGLCVGVGILIKCLVKNKPRAGNTSSSTGINLSRVSGLAYNIDGPCLGLVYHF